MTGEPGRVSDRSDVKQKTPVADASRLAKNLDEPRTAIESPFRPLSRRWRGCVVLVVSSERPWSGARDRAFSR